ncbi:MAG TPA: thermonuclease family protein [Myxococcota bacterium]|nr:thermonuclease family protein [Myxococcota bacterium]HRY95473.1 thermonuclease family protein [Myxococcota bacterium]
MGISKLAMVFLALPAACATDGDASDSPFGDRPPAPIPTLEELSREAPPMPCLLVEWEDGDTPYVRCSDGGPDVAVRLVGVDTAESGFDRNSRARARRQARQWGLTYEDVLACGKLATARARELCPEGAQVEVTGSDSDAYGRRLGYVVCKKVNLNERLVADGLAGRYPYPGPPERPARCTRAATAP